MQTLFVIYDDTCSFCVRCRRWLEAQEQLVPLFFVALHSEEGQAFLRRLRVPRGADELIAIDEAGSVYRESDAWIICLWSLRRYRHWAHRLARPRLRPAARRVVEMVSRRRQTLSRILGPTGGGPFERDSEDQECPRGCDPR